MPKKQNTSKKNDDFMHGLGANERAILERIPVLHLRKLAANLVRLKMRLQFTGWLQYMLPVPIMLLLFLIAGIAHLLGGTHAATGFALLGALLLLVFTFDLITVNFRLRFPERLPKRNDDLDLFDLMRARRSCRSFQIRKLTPADHAELMESVQRHSEAPMLGTSPVRFEYIAAPLTVWPTVNASEFLVAIVQKEYDRTAVIDVGRSLQKVVMDATRMGLGTCWIGPGADHASIIRDLGERFDPEEEHIICVCAVGYKSKYIPLFIRFFNAQFKRRLPLSELFFTDADFNEPLNLDASPFNHFGRNYEICQWAPSSYNGQTTRAVAVMTQNSANDEDAQSLERFDFYQTTASRYYAPVAAGIWCANWELGCDALGIQGRATLLSEKERNAQDEMEQINLPRYDLSWVISEGV